MSDPTRSMQTISIHELLERSARSALDLQREDGSLPPGRNYTYDEPGTPVRTTAHWLTTFSKVYDISGDDVFKSAAQAAVDYLLSDEARPHEHTFYCRNAKGKDKCNGLVGQAGPIRALTIAARVLGRDDALEEAHEVFSLHPFNKEIGLWEKVEIDGTLLSFDRTLNHQILFASGSSDLAEEYEDVSRLLNLFLDRLEDNLRTHPDGLIKHYAQPPVFQVLKVVLRAPRHYEMLLNEVMCHYYLHSRARKKKERGYQTVNLTGLSSLKHSFPNHDLWDQPSIRDSLSYVKHNADELLHRESVTHGSTIPGVDLTKISSTFETSLGTTISAYIEHEIQQKIKDDSYLLRSSSVDQHSQAAQISSFVDLPNITLELDV